VVAPIVLDDEALRTRLDAGAAVAAIRQALIDAERGTMAAPPRVFADLGTGRLVFTSGARTGKWFGYRSYDTFGLAPGEQVVVLHNADDGLVTAIAVGNELGPRRTGATGGVAVDVLARPGAALAAMIGTGTQAGTQLWAINAVRDLEQVLVWSRDPNHRADFVRRARNDLGVKAREAVSAEQALRESDLVVLATNSGTPVIRAEWVRPGSHVTTLGPKQQGRAEFDLALADRAEVLVADSVAQVRAYQPPFVLEGTAHMRRMVSLGSVIEGASAGRTGHDQVTLYCSVGLAGTEVHLLAALANSG
jgi:ornithine cyclodeaminase/alanine dehydrogenase-like protein (mu-crystallin family)